MRRLLPPTFKVGALVVLPLIVLMAFAAQGVRRAWDDARKHQAVLEHVENSVVAAETLRSQSLDADALSLPPGARAATPLVEPSEALAHIADRDILGQLQSQEAITRAVEDMAQERALIASVLSSRVVSPAAYDTAIGLAANRQLWMTQIQRTATPDTLAKLQEIEASTSVAQADQIRSTALLEGPRSRAEGDPAEWTRVADERTALFEGLASQASRDLRSTTSDRVDAASQRRTLAVLELVGAIAIAVAAIALWRRWRRNLRPSNRSGPPSAPPHAIDADGPAWDGDAVVWDEAVVSANAVGLGFGRRSQGLVSNQLRHIDELESRSDNPDQLADLFQLDHLTTRLRRNAESLVVIAGAESPRLWDRPVSVVNAVRAAVAEASDYSRVDVEPMPAAAIDGASSNDVSHLLAELIDNALEYSPPDARVTITGHPYADGSYLVQIVDRGKGMSDQHLAEANEVVTNPSLDDVTRHGYFGLFVVGRLAQRHSLVVRLNPVPNGGEGVSAHVFLPPTLMSEV